MLPVWAHLLAWQSGGARIRHGLAAVGGIRDGPVAHGREPAHRAGLPRWHCRLFYLAGHRQEPPRARSERVEGGVALRAADIAPGADWRDRSRILRDGDVSLDTRAARHRFC